MKGFIFPFLTCALKKKEKKKNKKKMQKKTNL